MTIFERNYFHQKEKEQLAPYAALSMDTRGRAFEEPSHPYRTEFQRDRERIIHSKGFRRLEYKTQVFLNHEGDHFRTRLTHTIEVAQISRTIARALRLNEDLAEAIALAHDLGHTPFGHAGERELNKLLNANGGFEHNRQSLRVVELIEDRYTSFKGLNLTWETREGIIKHSSAYDNPELSDFSPTEQPTLEAQLIDLADEIAYNNHDLDDGFTMNLISINEVESLEIWQMAKERFDIIPANLKKMVSTVIRTLINLLVTDLINNTETNIEKYNIASLKDVRNASEKIVYFSEHVEQANNELKAFLMEKLYQHPKVARMTLKSERVIKDLFHTYIDHPYILEERIQKKIAEYGLHRAVTDYIAGMTDRFALEEHKRLTDPMIRV